MRIGLLGWGSLLWDEGEVFASTHGRWHFDGPVLPLEFSRISRSRAGALTLVVDGEHGSSVQTAYCVSHRTVLDDAVADLRLREGTTDQNIGYVCLSDGSRRARDPAVADTIATWAGFAGFDAVVWTDLPANFEAVTGSRFSVDAAIHHLATLESPGQEAARTYLVRAPEFVRTPLRAAISGRPDIFGRTDRIV